MPLINCKIEFSLKWYEECILSSTGTAATFTITDAKLYVHYIRYIKNWRQYKTVQIIKRRI